MVDIAIGREQPSGIERNKKSLATELIISPSFSLYVRKRTISSIYQGFEEKFSFLPQRSSVGVDNTRRKSDRLGREERMRKDSEPSPLSYNRFQATRVYKSFGRPPINLGRPRLVRTCTLLCPVPSTFSRPNSRVPGRRNFPPSRQASGRRNKGSVGRETTSSGRDIRAVLSPRHQRIMIKKEEKRRANFDHDGYDSWLVSGGARGGS